jgi:DNA-binding MarR family transcriptional regulator
MLAKTFATSSRFQKSQTFRRCGCGASLTPQGAALAVAHLRKIGWVTASQARGRGRSILLEITDKGRDGYLKAAGVVEQVDKSLTGGMTASERKGTLSGLRAIAGANGSPR